MDEFLPELQTIIDAAGQPSPDYVALQADLTSLASKVRKKVGAARHWAEYAWKPPFFPNQWTHPKAALVAQHLNQPVPIYNVLATIEDA